MHKSLAVAVVTYFVATEVYSPLRVAVLLFAVVGLLVGLSMESTATLAAAALTTLLGWGPIVGWIPNGGMVIDIPLALSLFLLTFLLLTIREYFPLIKTNTPSVASYGLVGIGVAVYWRSYLSGTDSEIFSMLFRGWDHSVHYWIFQSIRNFGEFIPISHAGFESGVEIVGDAYPAGMHYVLATLFDFRSAGQSTFSIGLLEYSRGVVVIQSLSALLVIHSICRALQRPLTWWKTIFWSISVVGVFTVGPLGIGVWNGYPNFSLAIAGAVIAISFAQKPPSNHIIQALCLVGAALLVTYNWWPILVPIAPMLLFRLIKLPVTRQLRTSLPVVAIFILGPIGMLIALLQTVRLGAKHVEDPLQMLLNSRNALGVWAILFLILGVSILLELGSFRRSIGAVYLVLGPLFGILWCLYIFRQTGIFPYYAEKLAVAILVCSLFSVPIALSISASKMPIAISVCYSAFFSLVIVPPIELTPFLSEKQAEMGREAIAWKHANQLAPELILGVKRILETETREFGDCNFVPIVLGSEQQFSDIRADQILLTYWSNSLYGTFTQKNQELALLRGEIFDPSNLQMEADCPIMLKEQIPLLFPNLDETYNRIVSISTE